MDSPFLGSVIPSAINFIPVGYMSCEGQSIAVNSNPALYALIGTIYGGDGVSTFKLPDLRGRYIIGQGQGPGLANYIIGQAAGGTSITLSTSQMPAHNHSVAIHANTAAQESTNPSNTILGGGTAAIYTDQGTDTPLNAQVAVCGVAGSGVPFSIANPYVAMYYFIATEGIFPTRN